MSVSQAPATIENPISLELAGVASSAYDAAAPGTLLIAELSTGETQEVLAILATSYQEPPDRILEQMAIERIQHAVISPTDHHASENLRNGFRDANRAIVEIAGVVDPGVALLALYTRGKYATLALVGQDRAYLARAGRLNQLTRDQRVALARSRRKQDAPNVATGGAGPVRLLGEADRLDSMSPAIFEIVLLPEDKVALLSHDLIQMTGEEAIQRRLATPSIDGALALVSQTPADSSMALMAAVIAAAPAREPVVFSSESRATRSIWIVIFPVVLLLAAAAAVAYFLL